MRRFVLIGALLGCIALTANVSALQITAGTTPGYTWIFNPPSNKDAGQIQTYIENTLNIDITGDLSELFKEDSSSTTVNPSPAITPANYTDLWLFVKDGNHTPSAYLFNLKDLGWTGDAITLANFWPDNGNISHSAIYGTVGGSVPDGGATMILLGIAFAGLGAMRRFKNV